MWEKKKPIKGGRGGCLICPPIYKELPLGKGIRIAVGFGDAVLIKDNITVWSEESERCESYDDCMLYDKAEEMAAADPDHDWRIHLIAPLKESYYQRQGTKKWVLYKKGQGFA